GDFVNLLQPDILIDGVTITESDSMLMLQRVFNGHAIFFETLRHFMSQPEHHISIVTGNHDQGLLWHKIEGLLKKRVSERIMFYSRSKSFDSIYIEHGNNYDMLNGFDIKDYSEKNIEGRYVLNTPWGSYFVMTFIYPRKKKIPYLDKIKPLRKYIRWGLFFDTVNTLKIVSQMVLFYFRNRFHKNPQRRKKFSITIEHIMESLRLNSLTDVAISILKHTNYRVVIFGHSHQAMHIELEGKEYINTGTWTEMINMNIDSLGRHTRLNYALIDYRVEPVRVTLREWHGKHKIEEVSPF
ncbi:MAG: hypothetical protein ACP5PA_06885, partial [Elusimicrobiales bacterium]